jgi:ribosomal protein S18 acetylase RimI-like enzyme
MPANRIRDFEERMGTLMPQSDVALLEEMNLNAWPALKTVHLDGWMVRSSGGDTRRPNSVNVFGPSTLPLADKIALAESAYRRLGRRCFFRITPLVDTEIPDLLSERHYTSEGATFVQTAELGHTAMPDSVEIMSRVSDTWLAAALGMRGVAGEEREIFRLLHRAIAVDAGWGLIRLNSQAVACGCVSVERGWSGLTGIYVHRDVRGHGLARKITEALMSWARERGARRMWLQVDQTNEAAISLYSSLGFRTAYTYHYRVAPEAMSAAT